MFKHFSKKLIIYDNSGWFGLKPKVLIVDDEEPIVTLLTYNVEKAGFITEKAYDGLEAVRKAQENDYDIIILDIMLPKLDGMKVCKHLRESNIETPILMLTARDDEFDKILGLDLGADDYLTKPFSPREVIARMKAILRRVNRSKEEETHSIQVGNLTIYPRKYKAELRQQKLDFTRMEFELLLYLAQHKDIVLSRDKLLKEVWNYEYAGDTRIVDVHISRLREKIESNTKKPLYIKTIHGLGYKMETPKVKEF